MQVSEFTEDHPYWGTLRQSQIPNMNLGMVKAVENRPVYDDRGHVQPATKNDQPPPRPKQVEQIAGGRRPRGMGVSERNRGRAREKRFGLADPIVWDAINRSLDQQRRLSTLIIPENGMTESNHPSEVPSRTSSQRKTLNRFTRQLKKYAGAAEAAGKAPVMTPTESESKVSYHTVQQLLPYRKEFQAAGLAVTSTDQDRGSPVRPRGNRALTKPLPKIVVEPVGMSAELDGHSETKSEQSFSSSGSFVDFTPGGYPIESLPRPMPKLKEKLPSKGKRGIFPWLKRKSPTREIPNEQYEPQPIRPLARDGQVQNRVKTIDSQNVRGLRNSRAFKDLPVLPPVPATPTKPPLESTRPFVNTITPKRPPLRVQPSTDVKQNHGGPRSELVSSQAGPGPGSRQSTAHTGLRRRDVAAPRVPRPETIEEEKENSPVRPVQKTVQVYPLPEPKGTPAPSTTIGQQSQGVSPQTTPSTIPSLPYLARHASRRPSSLERALDEVSEQLEKMEQKAEDRLDQFCSRPATLIEKTNQKEPHSSPQKFDQQPSMAAPARRLRSTEEIIYMDRKTPPVESPDPKPKKPLPPPPKPTRDSPTPPQKLSLPNPSIEKTLPALPRIPKTEDVLNDLDVFFNYDDADINDRDVIKGLQVAIHAAADNVYDALIRDKTGLRIRRFLADLRAVGEMQQETSSKDQRDKGVRKSLKKT
ncbi:hypothetical protein F4781DRAFT_140445 [Annulohypoxylon bovei var. microspora]|nr:hypothetical protein F4781DRAFT_140445 [Annulohypoxylon bovei var. microspora]